MKREFKPLSEKMFWRLGEEGLFKEKDVTEAVRRLKEDVSNHFEFIEGNFIEKLIDEIFGDLKTKDVRR